MRGCNKGAGTASGFDSTGLCAGFFGQLAGIAGALVFQQIGPNLAYFHAGQDLAQPENAQIINFYGAITAVVAAWVVMVVVTLVTPAKPVDMNSGGAKCRR